MAKPHYITAETWAGMTWKEQDFVILLRERRWTRSQIMRRLYITSRQGYDKLQKRVAEKIRGNSVAKPLDGDGGISTMAAL